MILTGERGLFTSSQERDVDVREGETAAADFVVRDILVSGRVTRAGQPAPGVRVTLRPQHNMGFVMASGGAATLPADVSGPRRLVGTTRDDGTYELLVDEPGAYLVSVASADDKVSFPNRTIDLPDVDAFALNLDFTGAPLAGVVVDRATGKPLDEVNVWARPKEQAADRMVIARTGADGRFTFELDPGTYVVDASRRGYAHATQEVALTEGGVDSLRLTLGAGASLAGRVVDAAGRGVANANVMAFVSEGSGRSSSTNDTTRDDGSFSIEGLASGTCALSAARDGRFAVLSAVTPGEAAVTLVLKPGALGQVTVRDAGGAPVEGAMAFVRAGDVPIFGGLAPRSDAAGRLDLAVPAGSVTVSVMKDKLHGSATVEAPEGGVVPVDLVLSPP